ncbi:hypothetical protein LIPSTDRAFT_205412 [Lipomyces starkeyi NRRL Y-11557]|uniref:Uncharacterized protein n=1 Tax=Lipomyces starkeyi NRRL Y-11557 TaxID=675824 RepID=A0A1E3QCC3_LIPST|nr:hypothetical protein LIPSTDRAFT_205412 [Lipomyces starkeyi NRRL Y-11557]
MQAGSLLRPISCKYNTIFCIFNSPGSCDCCIESIDLHDTPQHRRNKVSRTRHLGDRRWSQARTQHRGRKFYYQFIYVDSVIDFILRSDSVNGRLRIVLTHIETQHLTHTKTLT